MKKETAKRIFVFAVFGLFLLSFALSFVGAVDELTTEGGTLIKDASGKIVGVLREVTGDWIDKLDAFDILGVSAMSILGALILSVLAFVVFSYIPKINEKKSVPWILGIITGILLTLMFRPEEMFALFLSYKSTSLAILALVPAVILFLASIDVALKHEVQGIIAVKIFWILYLIFMIIQFIGAWARIGWNTQFFIIFLIQFALGLLIVLFNFNVAIANWIMGEQLTATLGRIKAKVKKADTGLEGAGLIVDQFGKPYRR